MKADRMKIQIEHLSYQDKWDSLFGIKLNADGMIQISFYQNIRLRNWVKDEFTEIFLIPKIVLIILHEFSFIIFVSILNCTNHQTFICKIFKFTYGQINCNLFKLIFQKQWYREYFIILILMWSREAELEKSN